MASSVASGPGSSMEKLRARRKSGSGTQRFWSTSSRCMIAICPAGPPKLMKPSFSQKRNASPKLTHCPPSSAGDALRRRSGAGAAVSLSAIIDFFIHRDSTTTGKKHVQPLPAYIEGGRVSACLGGRPLLQQHTLTVKHIEQAGLANRNVQELARRVEPESIRLAADRQAGYLFILGEVDYHNRTGIAGDERSIPACIEVQSMRTSAGHRDLRGYCGCAAGKR